MAAVEIAAAAVEDLDALIRTLSLSPDTRARVARSLRRSSGCRASARELDGRWTGFRFLLGPWRWLLLVYVFIESEERLVVVTIQDVRSSVAPTGDRG